MNGKCIVKLVGDSDEKVILLLKDYMQHSNVKEARKLTDRAFTRNKDFIDSHDYNGYKVTWSWYDLVHKFFIDFLEIRPLIQAIEKYKFHSIILIDFPSNYAKVLDLFFFEKNVQFKKNNSFFSNIKEFIFNLILLIVSLIFILFCSFKKGNKVATRTEDYIYQNTKSDFRLNHLYKKYKENDIQYIEFIRSTKIKNFFINIFKRKRFAIYYTSIIYFVDLFTGKTKYSEQPEDFYQYVLYGYHHDNIVLNKSTFIFEKLFKLLKIDSLVLISFSSRSAHLSFAAKSLGIKTIGIMHGLQQKDYAVYEFMQSYQGSKKFGCDVYGVWSEYYLEYFRKYSKISTKDSFQFSGLLRPVKNMNQVSPFERISENKIKVLLISEPLVSVMEIIPYIKRLLENNDIEVAIKVRPMVRDSYYEKMKVKLPCTKNLDIFSGDIHEVGKKFDVFVGSYSTAVIEASLIGKISVLLDTKKWGDYLDIDTLISGQTLLVRNPEALCNHIFSRIENERSLNTIKLIKDRFFGGNRDGAQWIVDQL